MKKIYLSGPITGTSDYRERFARAEAQVLALGLFDVINPADIPAPYGPETAWADWMLNDLRLLRGADVLVALPDSDRSLGCAIERTFALGLKIPVIEIKDFIEQAATK